jgi:hypothetical protein
MHARVVVVVGWRTMHTHPFAPSNGAIIGSFHFSHQDDLFGSRSNEAEI